LVQVAEDSLKVAVRGYAPTDWPAGTDRLSTDTTRKTLYGPVCARIADCTCVF